MGQDLQKIPSQLEADLIKKSLEGFDILGEGADRKGNYYVLVNKVGDGFSLFRFYLVESKTHFTVDIKEKPAKEALAELFNFFVELS